MKINTLLLALALCLASQTKAQKPGKFQIHFESGLSALTPAAKLKIDSAVKLLGTGLRDFQVHITGHTDNVGDTLFNQALSLRRAKETMQYFTAKGFPAANITISGRGLNDPLNDNATDDRKFFNRRVSIVISKHTNASNQGEGRIIPNVNLGGLSLQSKRQVVKNETGGVIKNASGTSITIPPSAFVDNSGKPVKGDVTVDYAEYRDPIDFILGGIPMSHSEAGKTYQFNSGGMFKISASYKGEPVNLKPGAEMKVDFALTQRLPNMNFYRFDSLEGRWSELAKITGPEDAGNNGSTAGTDENTANTQGVDTETLTNTGGGSGSIPNAPRRPGNDPHGEASCGMLVCNAIKAGVLLSAQNTPLCQKLYEPDSVYNRNINRLQQGIKDLEGLSKAGKFSMDSLNNVINREGHVYKVKMVNESKSKATFNVLTDVKNNNNELEPFKNCSWQYNIKSSKLNSTAFKKSWTSCRIAGSDGDYRITLGDGKTELTLDHLQLKIRERVRRKNKASFIQSLFAEHARIFEKYRLQMEELQANKTALQNELKKINQRTDSLKKIQISENWIRSIFSMRNSSPLCFWEWNRTYMTAAEKTMNLSEWCVYFDANKTDMQARYETIGRSNRQCGGTTLSEILCVIPMSWNRGGRVRSDRTMDSLTRSLSESIQIPAMGIYNFDVPEAKQNQEQILVKFKDGEENDLKPFYIFLVDKSRNGLITLNVKERQRPYTLALDRRSSISIIIIDKAGKAYACSAENFEALRAAAVPGTRVVVMRSLENINNKAALKELL